MKLLLDYFGLAIFAFVVFVGGLVALPEIGNAPRTSPGEVMGLVLAFIVIAGGFSWYYFAAGSQESSTNSQSKARKQF